MIGTVPLPSSSTLFLEPNNDLHSQRSSSSVVSQRLASTICCSSRSNAYIPKLEPFSRSKLDRIVKDPPLIEKSESELADYCSTLEGDASYSCWQAYFELKDLEKETPKQEIERVILQAGGVKSLIGCLHGISAIHKAKKECNGPTKPLVPEKMGERPCPIPDGLPKTMEELEEEEKARMPDSPFTRLLRTKAYRLILFHGNDIVLA
ncbi:unnamed protein product [Ilex paraguariensis]|uniref:CCG-binding protein 1 n=1 Tax=Ilex paraguariensis TaxID=185542 RepID=A0ABC8S1L0_9AQUA